VAVRLQLSVCIPAGMHTSRHAYQPTCIINGMTAGSSTAIGWVQAGMWPWDGAVRPLGQPRGAAAGRTLQERASRRTPRQHCHACIGFQQHLTNNANSCRGAGQASTALPSPWLHHVHPKLSPESEVMKHLRRMLSCDTLFLATSGSCSLAPGLRAAGACCTSDSSSGPPSAAWGGSISTSNGGAWAKEAATAGQHEIMLGTAGGTCIRQCKTVQHQCPLTPALH
jgi:hypothetical protein